MLTKVADDLLVRSETHCCIVGVGGEVEIVVRNDLDNSILQKEAELLLVCIDQTANHIVCFPSIGS